jgi:WD40 repeat protein
MVSSRSAALAALLSLPLLAMLSTAADKDERAEAALKALAERCKPGAKLSDTECEPLVKDLQRFQRAYPGTPYFMEAARFLSRIPSPLDRLDPAQIPALERFDWQPRELVAVIGEHRGRQGAPVRGVALSPDGTIAFSVGGYLLRLWDPLTLRLRTVGAVSAPTCVAVSKDGKSVAVGNAYGSVLVWDVAGPEKIVLRFTIPLSSSPVNSVSFTPDGKNLAAGCGDNSVRICDLGGKEAKVTATMNNHEKSVAAVAYSPDGKTLASGGADMKLRFWTIAPDKFPEEKATVAVHAKEITALAFNHTETGPVLASADAGGAVHLWKVPADDKPSKITKVPHSVGSHVHCLHFSQSGKTLAVGCADSSVRLWTIAGTTEIKLTGHAGAVTGVAYAPDTKTLLTGSSDWTVRSWDLLARPPADRFRPWSHLSAIRGLAIAPDMQTLATGGVDTHLRLWDLKSVDPRTRVYTTRKLLPGDATEIYAIAYSLDGKSIAVGGTHKNVRQYDPITGKSLRPVTGVPGSAVALYYLADGRLVGLGNAKQFLLWNAQKGDMLRRFETTESPFLCLAPSPDGRFAVTGAGTYLYDKDGKIVYKDGLPVYTDCTLRMWDMDSGDEVFLDKSNTKPIYGAVYTPDGRSLYSWAAEPKLRRWAVSEKKLTVAEGSLDGSPYPGGLIISPDGRTMAARVGSGTVVLYDLVGGKKPQQIPFNEYVYNIAFAADSRHLAVSLVTGVAYVLRLESLAK